MRKHLHLGAYGVAMREGRILLIRKARGPYTGLWDLPGGGLEFGEGPEEALRREFREEAGLPVTDMILCGTYHRRLVHSLPGGEEEDLHHVGLIYRVTVADGPLREAPDGLDSLGARWMALAEVAAADLSPLAWEALAGVVGPPGEG